MIAVTALESEYIRTHLYGPNNMKRRPLAELLPLLQAEQKGQGDQRISELNAVIQEIKKIGEEAEIIAKNGKKEDSLEYDQLQQRAHEHSNFSQAYMRYCYVAALSKKENAAAPPSNYEKKKVTATAIPGDDPDHEWQWPAEWKRPKRKQDGSFQSVTPEECMYQYCFYGLWDSGHARDIKMRQEIENYKNLCADSAKLAEDREKADHWLEHARQIQARAKKNPHDKSILAEADRMGGPLKTTIQKDMQKQADRQARANVINKHKVEIAPQARPQSNRRENPAAIPAPATRKYADVVYNGHLNDIFALTPAKEWALYIDESGSDKNFNTNGSGVIAGVLTDLSDPLPEQPQLHASTDDTEEKMKHGDRVIETILSHPQTGVLALPARIYQNVSGWGELIVSYIDLVLRMLPLNGKKTKLKIFVEARSPYEQVKDFTFIQDACRYQLIHTLPERAKLLSFTICKMDKENPMNAYPDIVAHSCFMRDGNPVANARFKISGWNGRCFLNYEAMEICNFLDYFHAGRTLQPAEWEKLVQELDAPAANFLSALLQSFGEEVRQDVALWKSFLDFFIAHLDSKAINIFTLSKQVAFLKRYQPDETTFPLRVRLMWLTAKLAESNHRGGIFVECEKQFRNLIATLFEEDAPLTCWATLHLAVTYTNAFEFQAASRVVEDYLWILQKATWQEQTPDWIRSPFDILRAPKDCRPFAPSAITGLRYFAQLLSTHGQHLAFEGKNDEAIRFFEEAIRLFRQLHTDDQSDEISQTSAYLLTSIMDCESRSTEDVQAVAERYFGMDVISAAKTFSVDTSDKNKYRHHILLRYALSEKAPEKLKEQILATESEWRTSAGHPWEMIEFYRALLTQEPRARMRHLQNAHRLCQGYDATLHVIDAVILGSILLEDPGVIDEYNRLVEQCVCEVPALGDRRIQVLRQQPEKKLPPLVLARAILPFNFR